MNQGLKELVKAFVPQKLLQGVRHRLLQRRIDSFPKRVVEHEYLGYPLKISIQDYVGEEWYDKLYGKGSMWEISFLQRSRLKPGARIFDLGAHQGVFAMILARIVGESGKVIAVEGTEHNAAVAEENIRINGIQNMVVRNAVAAEKPDMKISFSATLNGAVGDNLMPVEMTSVSIDSLAEEFGAPDVVFIDVEGYECQVLDGGKAALAANTDFFVEVHIGTGLEGHGSVEKLLTYFPAPKYSLYWSPEDRDDFKPFTDRASLPPKRFFLVAFAQ